MTLPLDTLIQRLAAAGLLVETVGRPAGVAVTGLAHDSREAAPGSVFVAVRGEHADGHRYVGAALTRGAVAAVVEALPAERSEGVVYARVSSTRAAHAELSAAWFGDPSRRLRMVGITGTNGKTTTSFLVRHALEALGHRTGLIGTVALYLGGGPVPATLTTPDAYDLQRMLRRMADAGCTACVMEVSSHALDQERTRGIGFDVAVFTNLTRDHLDYHRTFEAYFEAKRRLFDGLAPGATALYNADDPAGAGMVARTAAVRRSYGAAAADLKLEVLENRLDGLRLRLDGRERRFRLVGYFNAYNLAAAYGVLRALGHEADAALDALATAPPVPGRFEQMTFDGGTTAIVDYAHTPDALENVLRTVRETRPASARVWCVFGCGGDRDRTKRGPMGRIAERLADAVVVTTDNPRTEAPEAILADIRAGMETPETARWIVDRREAIGCAAREMAPGDVLVVAGKGHENYQIIGTDRRPFDDREEVRRAFETRLAG